jgi:hypothetical protein
MAWRNITGSSNKGISRQGGDPSMKVKSHIFLEIRPIPVPLAPIGTKDEAESSNPNRAKSTALMN